MSTTDPRQHLRSAIAELKAEQERLESLDAARNRAQWASWETPTKVTEAEQALREAKANEPHRIAYEFAAGEVDREAISPVEAAQAALSAAQAEQRRVSQIESALDAELAQVNTRVEHAQHAVHQAMAEIITSSPEYQSLLDQHRDAWMRLRTVRTALRVVSTGLHGNLVQQYLDASQHSEPLEPRVGYDIDEALVEAWTEAMAQLETDPDAPLPDAV